MKKSDWQYLIDTLLFICITGIVFIGFLLGLIIPKSSSVSESAKYFLGLHRHDWGDIHFYLSIAFTSLVIIHLILSWKWIKGKAKHIFKKTWPTFLTLTIALALVTPLLIWTFWPKYADTYADHGLGLRNKADPTHLSRVAAGENDVVVTGQTTLADVEKTTGISPQKIIEKLGLPKRVKTDETLGQLRKRYGLQLQDVRDIITELTAADTEPLVEKETKPKEVVPIKTQEEHAEQKKGQEKEEEHKTNLQKGDWPKIHRVS